MVSNFIARLIQLNSGFQSRRRNWFLKLMGCRIEGYAWIQQVCIPRQWGDIRIEAGAALDDGVTLICSGEPRVNKITIGRSVYINRHTIIDASKSVQIGRDVMIGPNCYITDHDHEYSLGERPGEGTLKSGPTRIGDRAWLGASVIVLKGVTIGNDTIVGAGSVVTKDVPDKAIAVGSPARVLKYREK